MLEMPKTVIMQGMLEILETLEMLIMLEMPEMMAVVDLRKVTKHGTPLLKTAHAPPPSPSRISNNPRASMAVSAKTPRGDKDGV
jgi:hypothetical protein